MARVSILIVSHSRKIGAGMVYLLEQLTGGEVHLAHAAGLGDELGTDALAIKSVIEQCPIETDVLVFFDLGSALINTRMAIDLLPDALRGRVHIVDAPMIEGAVVAAIAARVKLSHEEVISAATQARLTPKIAT